MKSLRVIQEFTGIFGLYSGKDVKSRSSSHACMSSTFMAVFLLLRNSGGRLIIERETFFCVLLGGPTLIVSEAQKLTCESKNYRRCIFFCKFGVSFLIDRLLDLFSILS